jgi:tetratricopeptide (TPR) repeat protein
VGQQRDRLPAGLTLDRYLDLIGRYRAGDFKWTVEELVATRIETVDSLSERLLRLGDERTKSSLQRVSDQDLQAAVLLHTQAAVARANERDTIVQEAHWKAAFSLNRHVGEKDFRRQWLIALGYFHQARLEEKPAVEALETALKEFPEDSEIRLALGTVYEALGTFTALHPSDILPPPPYTAAQERDIWKQRFSEKRGRRHLERARGYYREALASNPEFVEAHLRLGRVLHQLGQDEEALRQFGWVIENANEINYVGLSHLFAGRLQEHDGDNKGAIEHYRAAVALMQSWQLARLALSHALDRAGARVASLEVLERALRLRVDPRNPMGGLSDYTSKGDVFVNLVTQLRTGVLY